jgi:hypothetical protein
MKKCKKCQTEATDDMSKFFACGYTKFTESTLFPQRHENGNESDVEGFNKDRDLVDVSHTSCFGCKYDDIEMGEEERKANCFPCFEQVMIRRNYVKSST